MLNNTGTECFHFLFVLCEYISEFEMIFVWLQGKVICLSVWLMYSRLCEGNVAFQKNGKMF